MITKMMVIYILIGVVYLLVRSFFISGSKEKLDSLKSILEDVEHSPEFAGVCVSKPLLILCFAVIILLWPYMIVSGIRERRTK